MNACAWLLAITVGALGCTPTPAPRPSPGPIAASAAPTAAVTSPPSYAHFEQMQSPEVLSWVKTQNERARTHLGGLPSRPYFERGVAKYIETHALGLPLKTRRHLIYTRKIPGRSQPILVRSKRFGRDEQTLLDPNSWASDGSSSLYEWVLSHDERYLAYGTTSSGSDWRTWKVLDLTTGKSLGDELRGIKWSAPTWLPGDRGLLYSGYPDRSHDEAAKGTGNRVYRHLLGDEQGADQVVFTPENAQWIASPSVSEAQDVLEIYIYKSSDGKGRIQLYPLDSRGVTKETVTAERAHVLSPDFGYRFWSVGATKQAVFLFSNHDAPLGKIERYSLATKERTTIVPELEETLVGASQVGGRLFARYTKDVKSFVVVYDEQGKELDRITTEVPSNLWGFRGGRGWHDEAFFASEGHASPTQIHRYRMSAKKHASIWKLDVDFDPSAYRAEQVFYESKDGTKVPMFVVHHRSVKRDGSNPTLLFGYGCYGYLMPIGFNSARAPWLQAGGVIAVANIRGGGAYGAAWHRAGQRENKQNSIDDFIAAAEWLGREKVTAPDKLSITGASCGGLLVGAAATQRPELFAAAIPQVGILDLLRYNAFSGAYLWEDELGSPDVPSERAYLSKLSPLEAAKRAQAYPAMLITTRKKDTRVVPMNAYKFAAALLDHQTGDQPILLRVDEKGGHSLGALPRSEQVQYLADVYAFAWDAASAPVPRERGATPSKAVP
jgi:prolyl oligopeptidase